MPFSCRYPRRAKGRNRSGGASDWTNAILLRLPRLPAELNEAANWCFSTLTGSVDRGTFRPRVLSQ